MIGISRDSRWEIRRMKDAEQHFACEVIRAADHWLAALEAVAAADEEIPVTENQQDDLDTAEVALAAAVKSWRLR
jgi:hypothetical protein